MSLWAAWSCFVSLLKDRTEFLFKMVEHVAAMKLIVRLTTHYKSEITRAPANTFPVLKTCKAKSFSKFTAFTFTALEEQTSDRNTL